MVSHSIYCMEKRAVHKISKSEIINIFFSVLAHQFFIPHPQGRMLSMVLYAAFG